MALVVIREKLCSTHQVKGRCKQKFIEDSVCRTLSHHCYLSPLDTFQPEQFEPLLNRIIKLKLFLRYSVAVRGCKPNFPTIGSTGNSEMFGLLIENYGNIRDLLFVHSLQRIGEHAVLQ